MYGLTIDTLNVYTKRSDTTGFGNLIWTSSGEISDDWFQASIVVDESASFQVNNVF